MDDLARPARRESGDYMPKTLNNALTAFTVCLNQAVADGLIPTEADAGDEAGPQNLPSRTT